MVQFTTTHAHADGKAVPVEVNLQFSNPDGQPACFIAIARDISERRSQEERRNRTQRMEVLGTLAGGVAHDLNNALAPVSISIELLKQRHPEEAATLDLLAQSTKRGSSMVRQLLTFARGRDGERASVDGRRLVREMALMVQSTFPRNLNLEVNAARETSDVRGDSTQLHQVLLNLCVNARDAMPRGGVIRIGISDAEVPENFPGCIPDSKAGRYVCLFVEDEGPGMPPHIATRAFDPFFTTKAPGSGTGLGLSTVLGIVRSHGGFLRLKTEVGKGSRFEVYLPAIPASAADPTKDGGTTPQGRGEGRRLLLVDDDPQVRASFASVLSAAGFRVAVAPNGAEALKAIANAETPPEMVITDLDMPELGGRALVEALRDVLPGVPIVVITGLISEDERLNLTRDLRVRAVIEKPLAVNGESVIESPST